MLGESPGSYTYIYIYNRIYIGLCNALDLRLLFLMFCRGRVPFKVTFPRSGPINNRVSPSYCSCSWLLKFNTPADKAYGGKYKLICERLGTAFLSPRDFNCTRTLQRYYFNYTSRVGIILLPQHYHNTAVIGLTISRGEVILERDPHRRIIFSYKLKCLADPIC